MNPGSPRTASMRLTHDVLADPVALTRALVDIESVSGAEGEITDAVESALRVPEEPAKG